MVGCDKYVLNEMTMDDCVCDNEKRQIGGARFSYNLLYN
jgi:hypothetical protein